ncbi:HAD family hydrolase [Yoonia sediminilitoris]|uniref:phosphoglycolate phosphatase n=1 Tax=Yoonia sediminilitoris TaxID=1286148 RepID=A0A2T6KPP2_9RHOB|nr:HAD-IA family hydrolase [Yoonia sediminilitoris]PUB18498.1 AHBA synthesis associated protein [Yoonia sediminilitoris]RCW98666.1 AHBA synthesis associated protein [Yoonia sediminilitoris]
MMHQKKALLFDFDGVLINSLPVMQLAFSAALDEIYDGQRHDHDALFKRYQTFLGMGFPQIMNELGLRHEMFGPFRHHSRQLAPYVRLYQGATALLKWADSAGIAMGIATGKDEERTLELLERLGIRHRFGAVLCSDNVPKPKPAPDMAILFADGLGIPASDVIFVGDATADISCGKAAGCLTAAATWGYTPRAALLALEPDYVFETPQDAQQQLADLTTRAQDIA